MPKHIDPETQSRQRDPQSDLILYQANFVLERVNWFKDHNLEVPYDSIREAALRLTIEDLS